MRSLGFALLVAVAARLSAVTYVVPSDREMIQRADDIVIATGVSASAERTAAGGIVTRSVLVIEDVLKGPRTRGSRLVLTEVGGELPDLGLWVSGMPVYAAGQRYLVFTDANAEGEPVTWGLELGRFVLQDELALRSATGFNENWEPLAEEQPRDMRAFIGYIRGIVAQRIDPEPRYFVAPRSKPLVPNATYTRASYLTAGAPRWRTAPSAAFFSAGVQPGVDGLAALLVALNEWNATDSTIAYGYAGPDETAVSGFKAYDGINAILFNDPNAEVSPPVLARGGYWSLNTPFLLGGETFRAIEGIDIVVDNRSFNQACLNTILTHETEHTLGFRHSNENGGAAPAPPCNSATQDCTSNAIMNSSVDCSSSSVPALRAWDRTAAATVYFAECTQPTIAATSAPQSKAKGEQVTLSVVATGSPELHFQWYEGAASDPSTPVGSDSASFTSGPLSAPTMFWVKVTNGCGEASSNAIAVNVTALPRHRSVRH